MRSCGPALCVLPPPRQPGDPYQGNCKEKYRSGNESQMTKPQVLKKQFRRDKHKRCVSNPAKLYAPPARTEESQGEGCRTYGKSTHKSDVKNFGRHAQRHQKRQSPHCQRRDEANRQASRNELKQALLRSRPRQRPSGRIASDSTNTYKTCDPSGRRWKGPDQCAKNIGW